MREKKESRIATDQSYFPTQQQQINDHQKQHVHIFRTYIYTVSHVIHDSEQKEEEEGDDNQTNA